MNIYVGDITKVENIDAIVNAANAIGVMGRGVAGAIAFSAGVSNQHNGTNIKEIVKKVIEEEGPFQLGDVYVSDSGLLKRRGIKYIYHAVTMQFPGGITPIRCISPLLKKVLDKALLNNLESIAFGGLGCGIGGLDKSEVALRMASVAQEYHNRIKITVVDTSEEFINSFKKHINIKLNND